MARDLLVCRGMTLPTVLVVDDEALIRWSLTQSLEALGFTVLEAEDGRSAWLLFSTGVDAVLLDLQLPDTNGIDLLRRFKGSDPRPSVILMSASITPEQVQIAHSLGASAVVLKPFGVGEMIAHVKTAMTTHCHAESRCPPAGREAAPQVTTRGRLL